MVSGPGMNAMIMANYGPRQSDFRPKPERCVPFPPERVDDYDQLARGV